MNKFTKTVIAFMLCYLSLIQIKAQEIENKKENAKNAIKIDLGYSVPNSLFSFKTNFKGLFSGNLNYNRTLKFNIIIGANLKYALFETGITKTNIDSKMNVFGIALDAGYKVSFLEKMEASFVLKAGYSNILFYNKTYSPPDNKFSENGLFCEPVLNLNYYISKKVGVGINSAYTIIFKRFGDGNLAEDPTIRFFNFCGSLIYLF